MMKVLVRKARVHVAMRNKREGSVLQGAVKAGCLGIETRLDIGCYDHTRCQIKS